MGYGAAVAFQDTCALLLKSGRSRSASRKAPKELLARLRKRMNRTPSPSQRHGHMNREIHVKRLGEAASEAEGARCRRYPLSVACRGYASTSRCPRLLPVMLQGRGKDM